MTDAPIVALAGAGGDLGARIATALTARGAIVRALVRSGLRPEKLRSISATGAAIVEADPADLVAMTNACAGATCVVSALNGVRSVMIDRQSLLLEAAVRAAVPRFIPSDYSADFTRTRPGDNRNFDLRREFMAIADKAPIRTTSVLNGAFMDMLSREMPIIRRRVHRVLYWHDADQPLDFTTKENTAAYVAAVALDETTPRILRIAGDTVSARDIAHAMTTTSGERYRIQWAGSLGMLGAMILLAKLVAPRPDAAFPPWQGMQYMRDQFSGRAKFQELDNERYSDLRWTSVIELFERRVDGATAELS